LHFICKLAGLFPDLAELFSCTGRKKILGPGNSACKWNFVVCPFVYEETNRSYPFANELNGLDRINGLAHL
jgi:hypothetical protein